MPFSLKRDSGVPLFYQIKVILKARVKSGEYRPGERIPPEHELCREFGVGRSTIRQAIEELVRGGILVRVRPKGTFVAPDATDMTESFLGIPLLDRVGNRLRVSIDDTMRDKQLDQILRNCEAQLPGVGISLETTHWSNSFEALLRSAIDGTMPDVVALGDTWVQPLARLGALRPLGDFFQAENAPEATPANEHLMFDGQTYGVPFLADTRALYYRRDWLSEAGFERPPTDHEELVEVAKAITNMRRGRYGFGLVCAMEGYALQAFMTFAIQRGATLFRWGPDGIVPNTDAEEFIESLEWYGNLVHRHGVAPTTVVDWTEAYATTMFVIGRLGMLVAPPSLLPVLENEGDLVGRWGVVEHPRGPRASQAFLGRIPLCVSSRADNPHLAWEIVRHITDPARLIPYCRRIGYLPDIIDTDTGPGSGDGLGDDNPFAVFKRQLSNAVPACHPERSNPAMAAITDGQMPVQHELRRMLRREVTASEAAHNITAALRIMLNQANHLTSTGSGSGSRDGAHRLSRR